MTDAVANIEARYASALQAYLARGGESLLHDAYELGREALAKGMGVIDMVVMHQRATATLDRACRTHAPGPGGLDGAAEFFIESLSPFEMLHRGHAEANAALRRLNKVLEDEARRIAHTLHDDAGQLLAMVYLDLAEAERALPPGSGDGLRTVRLRLDQIREHLRRLAHELRPPVLDDLGLLPALEFLADGVARRSGLDVRVSGSTAGRLGRDCETALYRIVQEALTNVTRHARARAVTIRLSRAPEAVLCEIRDDGIGFDAAAEQNRRGERGLGLVGIRERLVPLQGHLRIDSAPGAGTALRVTVPVKH